MKNFTEYVKILETKEDFKEILDMKYEDFVHNLDSLANDPRIKPFLDGGQKDGKPTDEVIKFNHKSVSVKKLIPTQNEIDMDKSLKHQLAASYPGCTRMIIEGNNIIINQPLITLNGKYILDGHHRWSQIYSINKDATVQCYDINLNVSPIDMLKIIQMSIANDLGYVPVQTVDGTNLLKVNNKTLESYIKNNLSQSTISIFKEQNIIDVNIDENEAINLISQIIMKNIESMRKTSQPVKGAPSRNVMPQTDQANSWDVDLKKGEINFKEPLDINEMGLGDVNAKKIFNEYKNASDDRKKEIVNALIGKDTIISNKELENELLELGYSEIKDIIKELNLNESKIKLFEEFINESVDLSKDNSKLNSHFKDMPTSVAKDLATYYGNKKYQWSNKEINISKKDIQEIKNVQKYIDMYFPEFKELMNGNKINESYIINKVGQVDNMFLKDLLLKNPKFKKAIGENEYEFLKRDNVYAVTVSGKNYDLIITDGEQEFETVEQDFKLKKSLTTARPEIKEWFKYNKVKFN